MNKGTLQELTPQHWQNTFEKKPNCSLLQTAEWAALKSRFGWTPCFIGNDAVGALILFRKLPGWALGKTIAYIPRGPVINQNDPQALKDFWQQTHRFARAKKAIFLRVEPNEWQNTPEGERMLSSLTGAVPAFSTIQPPQTLIIPLTDSEDEWLMLMNQKTRYNIRLSQKKELQVSTDGSVADFKALMDQTGERDDFGVHSESYYQTCYETFRASGKAWNLIASYEGKPIAGLMLFIQGKRGYYLYGASSNEERNRMPNHMLQWTAMRLCREHGCTEYDLWGIPDENEATLESQFQVRKDGLWSVYRFKRGFGGQIKRTLGSFDFIYSPLLYKAAAIYQKRRRLLG